VPKFSFTVKARWYASNDNMGESYVFTGDNYDPNIHLQIGKKYHAIIYDNDTNIRLDLGRISRLLRNLSAMQDVGIDGRKFLVVGGSRDLEETKEEINHALEFINVLNNDSDRREQQE